LPKTLIPHNFANFKLSQLCQILTDFLILTDFFAEYNFSDFQAEGHFVPISKRNVILNYLASKLILYLNFVHFLYFNIFRLSKPSMLMVRGPLKFEKIRKQHGFN